MEQWRDVVGFEGFYQVSDHGRTRSVERRVPARQGTRHVASVILATQQDPRGYPQLAIRTRQDGVITERRVRLHTLVTEAFRGPRPAGMIVRHVDGDPRNCRLGNLAYGSHSENNEDIKRHGRNPMTAKLYCKRGHVFAGLNLYYRDADCRHRLCRSCRQAWDACYSAKKRGETVDVDALADSFYHRLMVSRESEAA